jgi:hypothetical protein
MGTALRIPLWIATLVLLLLAGRAGAADRCPEISAQPTAEQVAVAREMLSWNLYALSEELLGFEQADARKPVVLGDLYDGAEKPPPEATVEDEGPDLLARRLELSDLEFALLALPDDPAFRIPDGFLEIAEEQGPEAVEKILLSKELLTALSQLLESPDSDEEVVEALRVGLLGDPGTASDDRERAGVLLSLIESLECLELLSRLP